MKLRDEVGTGFEDDFLESDLDEIKQIFIEIRENPAPDVYQAEELRRHTILGMQRLSDIEGQLIKIINYLNDKIPSIRAKYALTYTSEGKNTTDKTREYAYKICPDAEPLYERLAKAKAALLIIQKKFDSLSKAHYLYRDISMRLMGTLNVGGAKNLLKSEGSDSESPDILETETRTNSGKSWV